MGWSRLQFHHRRRLLLDQLISPPPLGLGTVLTTLHRRRKARIHGILGIPDGVESAAIIPLGWPDREYAPNRRPPLARFLMRDRWGG